MQKSQLIKQAVTAWAGAILITGAVAACSKTDEGLPRLHRGDLVSKSNLNFDYIEGDLINCKNISVVYLKGDIRGEKTRGVHVQVMKGNVQSGQVKIDVLEGDIIDGRSVSVRLLLGEDLSGRADVLEQMPVKRSPF
jgi:hypothetical protein